LGPVLDSTVAGETLDNHKIVVRRIAHPQGLEKCRILFIGASEANRLVSILVIAERNSILTVSDMPGFSERGGMIGFVTQQDRVRFEVNRGAAEQAGLNLSCELLKVATRVIGNSGAGGL